MKKNLFRSLRSSKQDSLHAGAISPNSLSGLIHLPVSDANDLGGKTSSPITFKTPNFDPALRGSMSTQTCTTDGVEDSLRREERKEKVKERLGKYIEERTQLQSNCVILEQQLNQTTEKLREVDSKANQKIGCLESELQETRVGMEILVNKSSKEVSDQSQCIKTLGKKLIRQAHVIKQQKIAVEEYRMQLEALRDEMAMQDERDVSRDEEYQALKQNYDRIKEQKVTMQHTLQENIEEMMDLKHEREKAASQIDTLECTLQKKDTELEQVKRESAEKSVRITELEHELDEKTKECEIVTAQLKASERSVKVMKQELERSTVEIEDLRVKVAAWDDVASAKPNRRNFLGWKKHGNGSEGALEDRLKEQDIQIQSLDKTIQANEATISSLKSDMVKMSSSYRQDDYLKKKQIVQLKQANAEYALKLRSLEKAFKTIHEEKSLYESGVVISNSNVSDAEEWRKSEATREC